MSAAHPQETAMTTPLQKNLVALGTIARAHGTSRLSKAAGVSRAVLYNGLNPSGNPTLATVMAVMKEMGLKLAVQPAAG